MTDDSTHAQAKTPPPQPNPALKPLEGLVGDWEMELSHASFLPRPSGRVKGGPVLIEWVQDGAFLAMRMGAKSPGPPQALGHFELALSTFRGESHAHNLEDSRGKVVFGLSVSLDGVVNHEMKGTGITLVTSFPQRLGHPQS